MNMKTKKTFGAALISLPFLIAVFLFTGCPPFGADTQPPVLNIQIDKDNDSLLTFDTVIVKVYSKDSSFSQEVFHGKLTDPKQVHGLELDPRVGTEFKISIVGYKGGKVGVNKEVTILGPDKSASKDLPISTGKDTIKIDPTLPEIQLPADPSVLEGDTLRFLIGIKNPWSGSATLALRDAPAGAALDTVGLSVGKASFIWKPTYNQGRVETYAVTFVYSTTEKRVEKTLAVKILNVNRPPKITPIVDQKVKENETLSFKPVASDPDGDSLTLTASNLPQGATFASGSLVWKPVVGQAGNYSVKFKAADREDSDFVSVLITVGDVDPPPPLTVEITSPATDTTVNFTPITVSYKVNGIPLQKQVTLKEGRNRIYVDTTVLGRTAFDTVIVMLDLTAPGMPTVKGATPVKTRTPTWTWTTGGGGNGTYRYRVDTEDITTSTLLTDTIYTSPKDLDPGAHTLFVQERDAAGNWSLIGKKTIRIDTTRPTPPTVTVSPTSPTNNTLPTWTWSGIGEDISGNFQYKFDNADFRSGATETRLTNYTPSKGSELKEGPHVLYVQQQDSAGNWSLAGSAAIIVDLTPPSTPKIKAAQGSPTNNPKPVWSWTTGGQGGSGVFRTKLDDSSWTQGAVTGTALAFTPDTALKNGLHTLFVQEKDSVGNWSATAVDSVIVDLIPPTAPVFTGTYRSPFNSVQPTWTWNPGTGGAGVYRVRVDSTDLSRHADTLTQATYKPSTPLLEGSHTLFVQERDAAGNWSPSASQGWLLSLQATLGTAGFSAGEADFLSLVFDGAGIPYVAFADGNNANKVTVMRFIGGAWGLVGAAGFSSGAAEYISLTINKAGVPYVAFSDLANGSRATVFRYNAGAWEGMGSPGFSLGYASSICLGIGGTGLPYVAYQDQGDTGKATSMRFNGSEWISNGNHGFSAGDASFLSMAADSKGVPYVAYRDGTNGGKATVMHLNGNTWEGVGNAGFSAGRATATSMGISESGTPYVAFVDEANGFKLTVMRLNGSAWENVGSAGFTPGRGGIPSLAMGSNETPFVAFQDKATASKLTLMCFNGKTWDNVGNPGISIGTAQAISMGLNSLGIPYVAYRDVPSGNKATVIKAAFDP